MFFMWSEYCSNQKKKMKVDKLGNIQIYVRTAYEKCKRKKKKNYIFGIEYFSEIKHLHVQFVLA